MPTIANRSPSRGASNPNIRTPDGISNRWNSCTKPSNHNSDGRQRNFCRTGTLATAAGSPCASFELKENNVGRSRSPGVSSSSKGAKHFMSPTISASSKVTVASPRRKVLAERNEAALQSSLTSFPPPAADEAPLKPDAALSIPHALRNAEQMPKHSSHLETKCQCSDDLVEPVAPLDADHRHPPYDPETNYLSPRPRFLHYRPNPRIECSVHCERNILGNHDGRRLDDSFSSEIYDERSILSEEGNYPDPGEGHEEQSAESHVDCGQQFPDPQEDCEEQSADEQSDCEEDTCFQGANVVSELAAKSSGRTARSISSWYKIAPILLFALMACLFSFFWGTPTSSSSSVLNVSVFQVVNDIHIREHVVNSAMHVKELTARMRHLPFGSFRLYGTVATLQEVGTLYAANFTAIANADQQVTTDDINIWMGESPEQSYWEDAEEERGKTDGMEIEEVKGAESLECESKQEPEMYDSGDVLQDARVLEEESMQKSEMEDVGILDNVPGERIEAETAEVEVGKEQYLSYDYESKYEAVEGQEDGTAGSGSDSINSGSTDGQEISNVFNPRGFFTHSYDSKPSNKMVMGISSAVLLLSACLTFLARKQKKMPAALDAAKTPPPAKLTTKELISGSGYSYVQTSGSPCQNNSVDMMMVDDSAPSESSTGLQQSGSVGWRSSRESDEENSILERQRRRRRDSTVSSASVSYGSYTTFEKISAKKGPREEEEVMMTPVRRSSRIRNQIASP